MILAKRIFSIILLICSTGAFASDGSKQTVILGANVIDGNGGAPIAPTRR
jgi:hypothetical protein